MLEILAIIGVCTHIGKTCRAKYRSPIGFQIMAVLLWFLGEIFAAGLYVAMLAANGGQVDAGLDFGLLIFALVGGACGGGVAIFIAHMIPAGQPPYNPYAQSSYSQNPYGQPAYSNGYGGTAATARRACSSCGTEVPLNQATCSSCGEWFTQQA